MNSPDGNPLCATGANTGQDCSVLLGASALWKQIGLGANLNGLLADGLATSVLGNGDAFNLTLKQNTLSRTANVIQIGKDAASLVIASLTAGTANAVAGQCINALVDTILPANEVAALVTQPTADSLQGYLKGLAGPKGAYNIYKTLSNCLKPTQLPVGLGNSNLNLDANASAFWRGTVNFLTGFGAYSAKILASSVGQVLNSVGLGVEIGLTTAYWQYSKTFGVCEASLSSATVNAISNCAANFTFTPSAVTISSTTATIPNPAVSAQDAGGNNTPLPSDLKFTSDQPGLIAVDEKTGALTLIQMPTNGFISVPVNITVTDQSTGVTASYQISATGSGFTKISATGQDLPDNATTWSCVRHNATGLLWEAHVTRGTSGGQYVVHPCSWDGTLQCYGYTNLGNGSPWDAPSVTGSVCGKPGRLPTVDEGTALVNDPAYVAANPTLGAFLTTWFGADDMAWGGWTSSPVVGSPSFAWFVGFGNGGVYNSYRSGSYLNSSYVRLVAGP